ncbi:MAG: PspC domain-containing protein [Methanosarcinaceae archaeon]
MNKRLYRSRDNCMIAGVCGGIAEYFDMDPTLIRLLWILFTFAGGSGILVYIIAWIIIPQYP